MSVKISGFTIIKDAVINGYPIVEAISSILPLVDEMIVSIGQSEDDTVGLIQSINSEKIKIIHSEWDMSLRKGGKVLAVETDKAFNLISSDSDWAFYIQADEVLHEKYHETVRENLEKYVNDTSVEGLLFNYLHFYGTYDYTGDSREWYRREIRIIRNESTISAYRDAQGFRKASKKLNVKHIPATIYYYGWVKSPLLMKKKIKNVSRFWNEDKEWDKLLQTEDFFDFTQFDSLELFDGTHPLVMQERVNSQNWKVELDLSLKKFNLKDRILYWFEKKTGIRLFEYRNYKII